MTDRKNPGWLRILRSLQAAGPRGITQADWNQGGTPDGGPPIPQIARRIHDLIHKHGCAIEKRGERDGFARYVLVKEPWQPIPEPAGSLPDPPDAQSTLVDLPAGQQSLLAGTPYDPWSEAA